MIPHVAFTIITILTSFGHHKGVQCFKREIMVAYNNDRNYDVSNFLNFNIDQFDLHNRQCFLAFLVYTANYMFKSSNATTQYNNIADIYTFITRSIRILNVEFTSKFGNEILILFDLIRDWDTSRFNLKKKSAAQNQARLLIKLGRKKYVWNTEKEAAILKEYKTVDMETPSTRKAYKDCTLSFQLLAHPTKQTEKSLQKVFSNPGWSYLQWGYTFQTSELKDFGTVLFFVNYGLLFTIKYLCDIDEFRKFPVEQSNVPRNRKIIEYLQFILIEILKTVRFVIGDLKILERVARETNVDLELLTILKHLYRKIADTTQDLYLLLRHDDLDDGDLKQEYSIFNKYFQFEWNFMSPKNTSTAEKTGIFDVINAMAKGLTMKIPNFEQAKTSDFVDAIINNLMNEMPQDFTSDLVSAVGNAIFPDIYIENLTTVANHSDYDRKLKPSSIRFFSALSDSWMNGIPSESTINRKKIILHEINVMLTIVKHNVYTLTAAARNTNKERLAWDCGYINGCKAPSTGTLGFKLILRKIPVSRSTNLDFMAEFQKAREFIRPYFERPAIENVMKSRNENNIRITFV